MLMHADSKQPHHHAHHRHSFMFYVTLSAVVLAAIALCVSVALAEVDDVPIGGFQPWVAFTLTDEFSTENQDDLFFVADVDSSYIANRAIPSPGSPRYEIGLLDSGAQVSLLQWQTMLDFDLPGQGFTGTEFIPAVGVSGTEFLRVEDPLGMFAAGLQHATTGTPGLGDEVFVSDTTTLRGLKSNAPATAPIDSQLPNVVGLPMMSTHTTVIRNSQPQFVTHQDESFRAPSVEFLPLGAAIPGDFTRRAALSLDVNATFGTTEPLYVFNVNNVLSGLPLHEDPSTPTAVGGAFFTDLELTNNGTNKTAEVFFDTGAQVSVVNELVAAQLGFDVVNDDPEFTVPILGVGGTITEIPGFTVDQLVLPAVGGNFVANDVPFIVLTEIPNPTGTGILDGILGTNVFWDRDLVIDPDGSRLWISDPVYTTLTSTGSHIDWQEPATWNQNAIPTATTLVNVHGDSSGSPDGVGIGGVLARTAGVDIRTVSGSADTYLAIGSGERLDVYNNIDIGAQGLLVLWDQVKVNAGRVEVEAGGQIILARVPTSGIEVEADVRNAGVIEAGFTINGDYDQTSEGTLRFYKGDVSWAPLADVDEPLQVTGSALLDGVLLMPVNTSRTILGVETTILTADSIAGVFSEVMNIPAGIYANAITYSDTEVLSTIALLGDANLSGQIEQGDLDAVLQNWGQSNFDGDDVFVSWVTGDLNGNGQVEQGDLDAVLQNWGDAAAPDLRGFVVPEPTAALVCLVFLAGRRSRRCD